MCDVVPFREQVASVRAPIANDEDAYNESDDIIIWGKSTIQPESLTFDISSISDLDLVLRFRERMEGFVNRFTDATNSLQHMTKVSDGVQLAWRRCSGLMSCANSLFCSRCHVMLAQFSVIGPSERGGGLVEGRGVCFFCFTYISAQLQAQAFNRTSAVIKHRLKKLIRKSGDFASLVVARIERLSILLLDWLTNRPPFVWLVPRMDFGDGQLNDEEEEEEEVQYVPVHPNDLLNNMPGPRRMYWKRRY